MLLIDNGLNEAIPVLLGIISFDTDVTASTGNDGFLEVADMWLGSDTLKAFAERLLGNLVDVIPVLTQLAVVFMLPVFRLAVKTAEFLGKTNLEEVTGT